MAAITANFTLSFDITNDVFVITDTTDYAGQGEAPADWDGILKITSPAGLVIYNNLDFGTPDIDPDVSTVNNSIVLPKDAITSAVLLGTYEITYTISDGVDTCPVTKKFNFQYERPTASLNTSFSCVTPVIRSEDSTNYLVAGKEPTTITRVHTLYYPDTTGEADIVANSDVLQTSTMYVLDNGEALQYEFNLVSTLVYDYTGSGLTSDFSVNDEISVDDYLNISCDPNLCSVYCIIKAQYDLWLGSKGTLAADKAAEKLYLLSSIAQLAKIALECNREADVTGLLEQIKTIAGASDDCACGDGEIVLYKGLGVVDPGIVINAGSGITVSSVDAGGIITYTISIEQVLLDTINSFETSAPVDGDQIAIVDNGVISGVRQYQVNLNLGLTAGNIPMVDGTGNKLEDSPLSYNGTSLAAPLIAGKNVALSVSGGGSLSITDTQSLLAKGAFSAGVFDDSGDTAGLVASATSHVKVKAGSVTATFDGHSIAMDNSKGITIRSVGADTANISIQDGVVVSDYVSNLITLATAASTAKGFFTLQGPTASQLFKMQNDGVFSLGLLASAANIGDVAIGQNATTADGDGCIAIGKDATAQPGVAAASIAIGVSANADAERHISIGEEAGVDGGIKAARAISVGYRSNYSVSSNGIGADSIAIGSFTINRAAAANGIAIGDNIDNTQKGAIIMGYGGVGSLSTTVQDSFNLGFNVTAPQLIFSPNGSYFNMSNLMVGDTIAAASVLTVKGDVEVTDVGNGYILKSPDASRWRLAVDNAGVVSASLA